MIAVFADPAAGVAACGSEWLEELFELLAHPRVALRNLPLGDPLEETAAAFARATRGVVDATEQSVRDGDEHLGHIKRIYGISGGKSWHGRNLTGKYARMARRR
jgi:hypothetical protein